VSVRKLNVHADEFDTKNRIIKISTVTLDHPSFSLYDYTGKRPTDTTSSPEIIAPETPGLQWNTDGWQLLVNKLSLNDGLAAIEREGTYRAPINEFDERHIILSDIKG